MQLDGKFMNIRLSIGLKFGVQPSGLIHLRLSRGLKLGKQAQKGTRLAKAIKIQCDWTGNGYIAGEDIGIVTVEDKPAQRHIWLFLRENNQLRLIADTWSDENGHYLFPYLNPNYRYLIMAADNCDGKYPPIAYDMVQPYVPTQ